MNFRSSTVKIWRGNWYGYVFDWIGDPARRERFMEAFKAAVPVKSWDAQSKVWWVPDLYSHIAESVALEHGALRESALADLKRLRGGATYDSLDDIDAAFTSLGLVNDPHLPVALVKRVFTYWEQSLSNIPTQQLELDNKRAAYRCILAQYGEVP